MVEGKVELKADNLSKIMESVQQLTKKDVLVGIPAENAKRQPDPEDPEPMSNAAIGYIMETGSPSQNIPARPHMIPAIKEQALKISQYLQAAAKAALNGDAPGILRGLNAAGLYASTAIKKKITDGLEPPLAASTMAARQREGFDGDKPLIRTGQYRNSITYVLRDQSQVNRQKDQGKVDNTPMVRT